MQGNAVGIGLAIGDETTCAAGTTAAGDWLVSQPSWVSVPGPAARVELLLAGDEAKAAGQEPLLRHPRRWRYVRGEATVGRELLAALLRTLHQCVPPARLAGMPVALALNHTVSAARAALLREAAAMAGWGEVRLVSELAALAALQPGPEARVAASEGSWLYQARFRCEAGCNLALTGWDTLPAAPGSAVPQPEVLAAGAARLAGAPAPTLDPNLGLQVGLVTGPEQVSPLQQGAGPGESLRALQPPDRSGMLVQLVAGPPNAPPRTCQLLAEAFLPGRTRRPGQPWLLHVALGADRAGHWAVRDEGGVTLAGDSFQIRLP